MLAEALILSILVSFVLGGRFSKLAELHIEWIYLPFISFGLERCGALLLEKNAALFYAHANSLTFIIELTANLVLLYFLYKNIRLPGIKYILAGTMLNFAVILANGGYMPVDPQLGILYGFQKSLVALEQGRIFAHELIHEKTLLAVLSDHIMIPPPWPFPKTISFGDVFIDLGAFLLIFKGMNAGYPK